MSLKTNILQVKHGDAFVLECRQGDKKGVIVVDGGLQSTNKIFKDALAKYECIDLMVLTHYDLDHIGGILSYFRSCRSGNKPLKVKEIWANCASCVKFDENTDLSVKQAVKFSAILQEYVDAGTLVWLANICEGYTVDLGFAKIEVVSPTQQILKKTAEVLLKEEQKQKESQKQNDDLNLSAHERQQADLKVSLNELAQNKKTLPNLEDPNQLANASSIAFIIECDSQRALMLGDACPQNIVDYLSSDASDRTLPIKLDFIKVSHHGSRNNTSNELLDLFDCQNYLISTNGGTGNTCHPDREAIANILCHTNRDSNKKVNLYFNYSKAIIERNGAQFINDGEEQQYNFTIQDNISNL